jgi:mono/diheme cytochrome c family protein
VKITALYAALAALLVAVPTAPAQPCTSARCAAPAVQAQPVVTQILGVTVPLYGAGYSGAGSEQTDLLRQLLEEIKALRSDVANLQAGGTVPPLGARAVDVSKIVKANCASCHTGGVADDKGGGFELFTEKGEVIKLSPADRRSVEKRVREGTMPPATKPRLSAEDKAALLGALKDAPKVVPSKQQDGKPIPPGK